MGGKIAERTLSSSPAAALSSLKGKKDSMAKYSGKLPKGLYLFFEIVMVVISF